MLLNTKTTASLRIVEIQTFTLYNYNPLDENSLIITSNRSTKIDETKDMLKHKFKLGL